jgi:DNA-binding NarL/FixJ family response regulator
MAAEITLIIADDHPVVRKGLREIIEKDPQLTVLAEAGNGEEALQVIRELQPQVAVLDVDMPKMDGFAVAREIQKQCLATEIVFLTMHSTEDLFNEAMNLNVRSYILKDSAVTDIIAAIKATVAKQYFVTQSLVPFLLNRRQQSATVDETREALDTLTPTERKILKLIAEYKSSKEIGAELYIHYRTVENHRANICRKLGLQGHNSLIRFTLQNKAKF